MNVKHDPPLILVADDQKPTAVMLERVFEYEGYQVESVYDGIAAVQAAQAMLPDLILLDINMPGLNGFEVLKQLRESAATASIPTILITAMGELSDVVHGLKLGADDYLRKPFHPQELLARAQSKMKARKLEETLQRRTKELEALLRVSEELSQHLEVDDLLNFILYLVTDLLPYRVAAIYYLDDHLQIKDYRTQRKDQQPIERLPHDKVIIARMHNIGHSVLWPDGDCLVPEFKSGLAVPMQHGGQMRGLLLLMNDLPYDDNHLQLLNGISRQAALALHNAEFYLHLEDMVRERTAELESAQQMLVRSEKLASVGRLAASVAHEINNPLLPIQINLDDMLEDIRAGIGVDEEAIVRTQESVERIRFIVNRLLEFTGNRQTDNSDMHEIDLNKVIQDIVSLNRKFFEQTNVAIDVDLSPLPPLYGSKYQLEHVFMNLALNAKDAMPKGGLLSFRSWSDDDNIIVEVEDRGSGISQDIIDNIFEPFVSTKEQGNGLGLFISYGIIEKHNGSIEVQSEVDRGTRFIIRLPYQH
jgi:signal transduction histidine kinase/CheY-like chemotaxis protein